MATRSLIATGKAAAVNAPDCAPAGMVMFAGREMGLPLAATELSETVSPPAGAGSVRVTVHVVRPPAAIDAGEQAKSEMVGLPPPPPPPPPAAPVMVPPVPDRLRAPPAPSEPMAVTLTAVRGAELARVKVIEATGPLGMAFEFIPAATHVNVPAAGSGLQDSVFPSAVRGAPADALTETTFPAG